MTFLFHGEKESIEAVLKAGRKFGYGNMISHLKREWAEMLIKKYGVTKEVALMSADADAYELRIGE